MNDNQIKRKALGRGLEELFNIEDVNYEKLEEKIMEGSSADEIKEIPLDQIRVNPYQPRKTFNQESLEELASSIKEHGVIQPIILKKSIKGYEIVAGERRFRASKLANKETIPAIIREFTDDQMMEIAVLENLQRENLNAIEEADAYSSLMQNLGLNQEELAIKVGKSRSYITNMLGLLRLPENVKQQVVEGNISMGHARVLSKLEDINKIEYLLNKIIKENLNVRELEKEASKEEYQRKNKITREPLGKEYINMSNNISEYLGTKVKIDKNKVEIKYANIQDLNRILDIIGYKDED